nr:EOG090X0A0V [Macrothrix elegans]
MIQVLPKHLYDSILHTLHNILDRNKLKILHTHFPQISKQTLRCIVAQELQKRMKFSHGKLTTHDAVEEMYNRYLNSVSTGEEPGVMLQLSDESGLSPALVARTIIERHYQGFEKSKPSRQLITNLIKNTCLMEDRDLALESYLCLLEDDEYGPFSEAMKQSLGQEYEILLCLQLESLKITFLHEDHLRMKGYDKTPDIKLEIPIAIDGQVINWIESKALFGDEEVHQGYLKDQLFSYWNRFGPGLVIYWFGYIEQLEKMHQNRVILVRDSLPKNISLMEQDPHNGALMAKNFSPI